MKRVFKTSFKLTKAYKDPVFYDDGISFYTCETKSVGRKGERYTIVKKDRTIFVHFPNWLKKLIKNSLEEHYKAGYIKGKNEVTSVIRGALGV